MQRPNLPYGYPSVPVSRLTGINAESFFCEVVSEETLKVDGEIYPIQPPLRKGGLDADFARDENAYASDKPLFKDSYRIFADGSAELYPFDYIPKESLLIVRKLSYGFISQNFAKASSDNRMVAAIYGDVFASFDDTLRDYYEKRGYSYVSYPLSAAGSTASQLDSFIEEKYASDSFGNVILIGNSDIIPYFTGWGTDFPSTDLYYSLMDTLDYFADVTLTRLPFAEVRELSDYVSKVEDEFSGKKTDYSSKAYFIASNDGYYHTVVESTHAYSMRELRKDGYQCDSLFGYYSSGLSIPQAVNDGRALAVYSGHGAAFYWAGPYLDSAGVLSLENSPRIPAVVSFACLTGNYSYAGFFGYYWLRERLCGSTMFIGASQYTYWDEDDVLQRAFIDSLDVSPTVNKAMNNAKMEFYREYGDGAMTRGYFERYNYFGLPELTFANHKVSSYSFECDRYQPLSGGFIEAIVSTDVPLSEEGYAGAFYMGAQTDSAMFSDDGTLLLDITSASLAAGDSVTVTDFVPGLFYSERSVVMIPDGDFVTLSSYELSDFSFDTFSFDLTFKNFGNSSSDSSKILLRGLDGSLFNLLSSDFSIPGLGADSEYSSVKGLVIEVEGYSDSAVSAVCSVYTVTGADTVGEAVILDLLKPEFEASFSGCAKEGDTLSALPVGSYSEILVSVKNLSALSAKSVLVKMTSKSLVCKDSLQRIDTLLSGESRTTAFEVFAYNSPIQACSLNVVISLGNYSDTTLLILPVSYPGSSAYLGPVNGYYIYTSEMSDFENAPKYEEMKLDSLGFRQLKVKDDTTLLIKLPFEFSFNGERRDSLYFNTNGILSFSWIPHSSYLSEPLPTSRIAGSAVLAGWLDYRCEYYDDVFIKPSDAVNTIFTCFDTTDYRYVIFYNKVTANDEQYTYSISIDTSEVVLCFEEIPESSGMVIGLQFADGEYLSYSQDTSSSQLLFPYGGLAVKFSPYAPRLKGKFTQQIDDAFASVQLVSPKFMSRMENIMLSLNKNSYYEVKLYDVTGRLKSELFRGVSPKGIYSYGVPLSSGVFFITVSDGDGVLLKRKIIVF